MGQAPQGIPVRRRGGHLRGPRLHAGRLRRQEPRRPGPPDQERRQDAFLLEGNDGCRLQGRRRDAGRRSGEKSEVQEDLRALENLPPRTEHLVLGGGGVDAELSDQRDEVEVKRFNKGSGTVGARPRPSAFCTSPRNFRTSSHFPTSNSLALPRWRPWPISVMPSLKISHQ